MTETKDLSLNEFYTQLLQSSMHETDESGVIYRSASIGHRSDQAIVAGRKLFLPTTARLKSIEGDELFFHPLSEQITRGHSTVFKYLKRMATLRLTTSFTNIGYAILRLQEHPEIQAKMNSQQQDFIKGLVDTDKNSAAAWLKMNLLPIERDASKTDKWSISIFLKNNGQFNGKNYRRVAVSSFPFLESIANGERLMRGEGADEKDMFRPKDYLMVKQLAETIFPGYLSIGFSDYNAGYEGATGPNLVAFYRAYKLIADRLNYILDLFKTPFENANLSDVEANRLNTEWADIICSENGNDDLIKLARRVPGLKGNIGSVDGKDELEEEDPKPPTPNSKSVDKATQTDKQQTSSSKKENDEISEEQRILVNEAKRRQQEYAEEEKRWKERSEENKRRDREDRYGDRDRDRDERDRRDSRDRERDRRDYRDDPPWDNDERDEPKAASGKISFSSILKNNRELAKDMSDRDERDRRDSRDRERDRRDYRDDRRDYRNDRRSYRGERDDRDYRDDRRDYRDDRRSYRGERERRDYRYR